MFGIFSDLIYISALQRAMHSYCRYFWPALLDTDLVTNHVNDKYIIQVLGFKNKIRVQVRHICSVLKERLCATT